MRQRTQKQLVAQREYKLSYNARRTAELATLKAENTRLREALELITSADCNCPGACDRCIAVEALEAK